MTVRELIEKLESLPPLNNVHVATPCGTEMSDCLATGCYEDDGVVWIDWNTDACGSGE